MGMTVVVVESAEATMTMMDNVRVEMEYFMIFRSWVGGK